MNPNTHQAEFPLNITSLKAGKVSQWAEADQPRYKINVRGKRGLTDVELLSLIIGQENFEIARQILSSVNNDLIELSKLSAHDLKRFKGLGESKVQAIIAAFELSSRKQENAAMSKKKISSSADMVNVMQPVLASLPHEEFWVIYLNRSNGILEKMQVSKGGVSGTVVDSRIVFKRGIELLASSLILCHNHPSGNPKPSEADVKLTRQVKEAGKLLDIHVLDHIIIAESGHYSFADEGAI